MLPPSVRIIDVEPVWSGHPVGFALLTAGDFQYVAYYDAERHLMLARRALDETTWTFKELPTTLGWDSHNYVTLQVDRSGVLHVSGNMHATPLIYFRGREPHDIASVEPVPAMTGEAEDEMTYPQFLKRVDGRLVFSYRDGGSGRGRLIYNLYDEATATWARLFDQPLLDGEGRMSAYPDGPVRGPDGAYHLAWVWRDTPAAETTHDVCYARSEDLEHWTNAAGQPLTLPLNAESTGVTVDPVPVRGGLINGSGKLGFDAAGRPIIAYHKFDDAGDTQLYLARWEQDRWRIGQSTNWTYRWDFRGTGSLVFDIRHGGVELVDGQLAIRVQHLKEGSHLWAVDTDSLRITTPMVRSPVDLPATLSSVQSTFPAMQSRWSDDLGSPPAGRRYRLHWESLPTNRDKPRPTPWPEPAMLQVVELPH